MSSVILLVGLTLLSYTGLLLSHCSLVFSYIFILHYDEHTELNGIIHANTEITWTSQRFSMSRFLKLCPQFYDNCYMNRVIKPRNSEDTEIISHH